MPRAATVSRKTAETDIRLTLDLDATGSAEIRSGLGFFDHMLTLLAGHSLCDLKVACTGDLHVDGHHGEFVDPCHLGERTRVGDGDVCR